MMRSDWVFVGVELVDSDDSNDMLTFRETFVEKKDYGFGVRSRC